MTHRTRTLACAIGVFIAAAAGLALTERLRAAERVGWELVGTDNGVAVFTKEVPGTDVVAFRGEGYIDASIGKVLTVLKDTPRKKEWMPDIVEARNLRDIGTTARVEYTRIDVPWPMRDRYFVVHAEAAIDPITRTFRVDAHWIDEPSVRNPELIEGKTHVTIFDLKAESPTRTWFVVEIHADPQGGIPKWMVNAFQRSWPRKFLEGVRMQVEKADVVEDPVAAGWWSVAH